jgi:phosphoribosylaminoimidazolecarboxamide formyltransferase/IMP cyclohydrolase
MNITPVKRALLSVSDKSGLVEFANNLIKLGIDIISTGGTSKMLRQANIPHRQVDEITGLPEMLDGRVKTLHPKVHGGILGRRDEHASEAEQHGIEWIDLVVVNFYPFENAVVNGGGNKSVKENGKESEKESEKEMDWQNVVEYIDIGGPTMVRAAAKNFAWLGVVTDPRDYAHIVSELTQAQGLEFETRKHLAEKAFALTSRYDAMIHRYFMERHQDKVIDCHQEKAAVTGAADICAAHTSMDIDTGINNQECPPQFCLQLEKKIELRYGENPHQKASAYQFNQGEQSINQDKPSSRQHKLDNQDSQENEGNQGRQDKGKQAIPHYSQTSQGILSAKQHQGKPLSYNNILDAEAALTCVNEFSEPACVIVKHANPCGAATAANIEQAYARAYQADPLSAFGGIIALNRPCTKTIAEAISSIFMEVVIAPSFTQEALTIFAAKPNLRVMALPEQNKQAWEMKFITGGILLQEKDAQIITPQDLKIVTQAQPNQDDIDAMLFAWRILKHIKSNGILIAKHNATIGIGAGQVSRIDAVDLAVRKAGENIQNAILASDAFFPFRDSIDRIAQTGVRAIIQPGGSVRDEEVIAACNENKIAMVFTGKRCFRH